MRKEPKEILFLVYKPGWWGCMDSIYREKRKDEQNHCTVLLIPYYERNAENGTINFAKIHYESDKMPQDINVVDYKTYCLEEHKMDMIYFHNPYDGQNSIETVEEKYYSKELKKYTDELIYVPHMLYSQYLPETLRYCSCYNYVDKILLPNDEMRYAFDVKFDSKLEVTNSGIVQYMDMLQAKQINIPDEWKKQLSDENRFGEKRSILLYISYEDLYYHTEKMIKKLQYIIDYMATREDILFLIRPDEEIERNKQNLSKDVFEEYSQTLILFEEKRTGIVDRTENAYLAAELTDVYMGNDFPMRNLFAVQGKVSVMIDAECRTIPTKDDLCVPMFLDCVIDGNEMWFVTENEGLICRIDLESKTFCVIDRIPDDVESCRRYIGIEKINDILYIVPYNSNSFWKYSIVTTEFQRQIICEVNHSSFIHLEKYKHYLFFIPSKYGAIIRYDYENDDYCSYIEWNKKIKKYILPEDEKFPYFAWGIRKVGGMLYMVSAAANVLVVFSMDTGKTEIWEMGLKGLKFNDFEIIDNRLVTIPYCGTDVYIWQENRNEQKKIFQTISNEVYPIPYIKILKCDDFLYLLPQYEKNIVQIDCSDMTTIIKTNLEKNYQSQYMEEQKTGYTIAEKMLNELIILFEQYDGHLILTNSNLDIVEEVSIRIPYNYVLDELLEREKRKLKTNNNLGYLFEQTGIWNIVEFIVNTKETVYENIRRKNRELCNYSGSRSGTENEEWRTT